MIPQGYSFQKDGMSFTLHLSEKGNKLQIDVEKGVLDEKASGIAKSLIENLESLENKPELIVEKLRSFGAKEIKSLSDNTIQKTDAQKGILLSENIPTKERCILELRKAYEGFKSAKTEEEKVASAAKFQEFADIYQKYPPGEMVDVGGYKLHLQIAGEAKEGQPTVVMESGLGGCSVQWEKVQAQLAKSTKAVSYDRAGMGWSETSQKETSIDGIIEDLWKALKASNIKPPYILVGHSIGGAYMQYYALKYREEVAGVVLVDPTPDHFKRDKIDTPEESPGLLILQEPYTPPSFKGELPPFLALNGTEKFKKHQVDTINAINESLEKLKKARKEASLDGTLPFRDKPLVVISTAKEAEYSEDQKKKDDFHKSLSQQSEKGKRIVSKKSDHDVQMNEPDLVTKYIELMMKSLIE